MTAFSLKGLTKGHNQKRYGEPGASATGVRRARLEENHDAALARLFARSFMGRDNIGITLLCVFFKRRAAFMRMRCFFAAFVRGLASMAFSKEYD